MSWAVGFDTRWNRDIGYGVPAVCDHPYCNIPIDRGLSYVCCHEEPYGGEEGCGLYFCTMHHEGIDGKCSRCEWHQDPFKPKPDTKEWMKWKLTDDSWKEWREGLSVAETRKFIWMYQRGHCISCDNFVTEEQAHMHEILPRGKGGKISLDNSEILCYDCHLNRETFGHGKRTPQFGRKSKNKS